MIWANPKTFALMTALIILVVWLIANYSYSTILANKNSQIELQDRQLADYKQKLDGANPDQAKARIDALESKLARLEPRRLTQAQRVDLTTRLRIPAGATYAVEIARDMACADCVGLAADFNASFNGAIGWQISNPMVGGIGNLPPSGIGVRCADIINPSPEARIIIDALHAVGIMFDLQPGISRRPVEILLTTRAN
jgi:hypothetical protein